MFTIPPSLLSLLITFTKSIAMFRTFTLLCGTLFLGQLLGQQTITGGFTFDNEGRAYRLHIPTGYDGTTPLPLVFNMHGYGSNAFEQELYSQMNPVADTANFFVCYPDGINSGWNVGWAFGSTSDDVGFINALIDSLAAQYTINLNRVYACGMSNGGFMSYRLACELNDRVAAIASVTGAMSPQFLPTCEPGRAVPVLEIHGTADAVVAYEGTPFVSVPVDSVISFWVANNACNATPTETAIPNTNILDLSTVTRFDYGECADNTAVSLLKVTNGGHTWPGSPIIVGTTNQDINASVEIWEFFNRYQLDGISAQEEVVSTASPAWSAYPNPGGAVLNFKNIESPFQLRIFDAQGRPLVNTIARQATNIEVHQLPAGVYFIEIIKDQIVQTSRWIKG